MGKRINIGDLDYTAEVLRTLGQDKAANELVDGYFAAIGDDKKTIEGVTQLLFRPLSDPYLKECLQKARSAMKAPTAVKDALLFKLRQGGYNEEHLEALRAGSAEEFAQAFEEWAAPDLPAAIKESLQLGGIDSSIPSKAWAALQLLAKKSKLNEVRLKRYGEPQ